MSVLPSGWELQSPGYFMQAGAPPADRPLAEGYKVEIARAGMVSQARIYSADDTLAASGFAAETDDAFIYDRIVTDTEHRRKGLGRALMAALHSTKQRPGTPELLVATEVGRNLYLSLGWQIFSPYATASITGSSVRDNSALAAL